MLQVGAGMEEGFPDQPPSMGVGGGLALKCPWEGLDQPPTVLCVVGQHLGGGGEGRSSQAVDLDISRSTCPVLYRVLRGGGGCTCGSEEAPHSGRRGWLLLL